MYTQRQIWKVMRKLVSNNNSEIRSIFSSDVNSFMKEKYKNSPSLYKQRDIEKQLLINNGMRNIYRSIVDHYFSYDNEAKEIYFDLSNNGKSWQDNLSVRDLFYLFRFQSNILEEMNHTRELLTEKSVLSIIDKAQIDNSFKRGIIEFTGKPDKTIDDKVKIDIESVEVINNSLKILEDEFLGNKKEAIEDENNIEDSFKKVIEPQGLGTFIGLDIQGSPIYENEDNQIIDCFGNIYNGQIFGLENDEFVEIGSSEDGVIGPIFKFEEDPEQ